MKLLLSLLDLEIPSIDSLHLADEKRLSELWSQLKDLSVTKEVGFFGPGEKLQPIGSAEQLVREFRKRKVESYSFADLKSLAAPNRHLRWSIGIRRKLLTVQVEYKSLVDQIDTISRELITLNKVLLSFVMERRVAIPFSFLRAPAVQFKLTRPPRVFGSLAIDSIFDIVYLKSKPEPLESQVVEQLKSGPLPAGARRTIAEDFLTVGWGDVVSEDDVQTILAKRYSWLVERIDFPIDSSFNTLGDKQFAPWQSKPTRQLTGYSSFDHTATKAIVFDTLEEAEEQLRELQRILRSGKTVEGYPVEQITLIVPSRESAVELQPLASHYDMQVVYVDDDRKLWNPFPPENEGG